MDELVLKTGELYCHIMEGIADTMVKAFTDYVPVTIMLVGVIGCTLVVSCIIKFLQRLNK